MHFSYHPQENNELEMKFKSLRGYIIKVIIHSNKNQQNQHPMTEMKRKTHPYLSLPTSSLCDPAAANAKRLFPSRAVNLYLQQE